MEENALLEKVRACLGLCLNKASQRACDIPAAKAVLNSIKVWQKEVHKEEAENLISIAENSQIPFSR